MLLTDDTQEWIEKAESDYRVATRELNVTNEPSYDSVCFHVQQCIEKYFKALLSHKQQSPPKIHHLGQLYLRVKPFYPNLELTLSASDLEDLAEVNDGAVEVRYPGAVTTLTIAQEYFEIAQKFRVLLRRQLGLE